MERELLETMLAQGMSAHQIGKQAGKGTNTVYYWMEKYDLQAAHSERHKARGALSEHVLTELVGAGKSIAEIAIEVGRSKATVRHWLLEYGLQTSAAVRRRQDRLSPGSRRLDQCRRHGEQEFVAAGDGHWRCVACRAESVTQSRQRRKALLVAEAGGCCIVCGYSGYVGSLHFHHLDPAAKSFELAGRGVARSLDRARAEAEKCVLLCANCHGAVEAGFVELPIKCE
jgi:transposase